MSVSIVLFHNNLRTADNRALHHAATKGSVIPLYIYDEHESDARRIGGAARWWLCESLKSLNASLKKLGAPLILRRGKTLDVLLQLAEETGATSVVWNRRYEPSSIAVDAVLQKALAKTGLETQCFDGFLLFDPARIRTQSGTAFKVFTPFSKACLAAAAPERPLPPPKKLHGVDGLASDNLDDWKLVPRTAKWPKGLAEAWDVSEDAAAERLHDFIGENLNRYKTQRDLPAIDGTSRMSPYLHFGQISPHQAWYAIRQAEGMGADASSAMRYLLELLWREFSWHLLHQFPELPAKPLAPAFEHFAWHKNEAGFEAWSKGLTGYPIVDAGMRQLWQTGWMHNRVRMIAASFLIKDLLIDWRDGERWFWDTLVDADLGSNSASWQWVAGCGADAAPFFRIFNPTLQGVKFDPDGSYVREYVPELAKLDAATIHEPWKAPAEVLAKAGIKLGKTYPLPIVDHGTARQKALAALSRIKGSGSKHPETPDLFG